jgi:hypothetical protein
MTPLSRYSLPIFLVLVVIALLIRGQALATGEIDEHNRFILNGEPFFPLGLYVVHCTNSTEYADQLSEIADSPFDTLMNYAVNKCGSAATDAQILTYLDELESLGLKLVFSLKDYFDGGQDDIDAISHKVTIFKSHPAVISWYLNDELDPATYLAQLEERYQRIKELDDENPVWSVHWNTDWMLQEAHTTDIVGMDSYPIAHGSITWVAEVADAASATGKSLWFVPQIFSWTDYPGDFRAATGRPPTKEEMRAMTYLAINHGARGLIYYSYFNIWDDRDYDKPETTYEVRWPQIKGIAAEIDELRDVILSTDETNGTDITCSHPGSIDFKLIRRGFVYYLFAVNVEKEKIPDPILFENIPANPEIIDVLFENGRHVVTATNDSAKFTDTFDSYEVHVYLWTQDGDIYCDGRVDLADAVVTSQAIADLREQELCLSADVNGDGKIDLSELIYILQYIAGLRAGS